MGTTEKVDEAYTLDPTSDPQSFVVKLGNQEIATITHLSTGKYWYISTSAPMAIVLPDHKQKFQTKADAFKWVISVHNTVMQHVATRPLPENVMQHFERRAREFNRRLETTLSIIFELQFERYALLQFAREYHVPHVEAYVEDSDVMKTARALVETKVLYRPKGKKNFEEIPFFSETFLYALVGKDQARTILDRLNRLMRHVHPQEF